MRFYLGSDDRRPVRRVTGIRFRATREPHRGTVPSFTYEIFSFFDVFSTYRRVFRPSRNSSDYSKSVGNQRTPFHALHFPWDTLASCAFPKTNHFYERDVESTELQSILLLLQRNASFDLPRYLTTDTLFSKKRRMKENRKADRFDQRTIEEARSSSFARCFDEAFEIRSAVELGERCASVAFQTLKHVPVPVREELEN